MKRKLRRGERNIITSALKIVLFFIALLIQGWLIYFIYYNTERRFEELYQKTYEYVSFLVKAVSILYILYSYERPAYKITWIIMIAFFPIFAVIMYILYGKSTMNKRLKQARKDIMEKSHYLLPEDNNILTKIESEDIGLYKQVTYLKNTTHYPVYKNKGVEYFEIGEKYFESLLNDINKAKEYILLEYFILAKGKLWNDVYDLLKKKAKEGIVVKIIIDEWGSISKKPKHLYTDAAKYGIDVYRYNPLRYGINNYINYRDHRKIAVIDGIIAYTGGVNIADEYVNKSVKFGHWKDNGIRLTGDVVKSFTISFLKNLEIASKESVDYNWYIERALTQKPRSKNSKEGYVMYYSDGPDNRKNPGENAYIQMLSMAKSYVYIYTPYFVVSDEMLTAILTASRSGIDVRIITPHTADKWYVHTMTRSFYEILLKSGVKVYEYLPGFLHAKTFVSDDTKSIIGSINLDLRSWNLNYECAVLTSNTGVEKDIRQDFIDTMNKSIEIKLEDVQGRSVFIKCVEAILNALAPLM